MKRQNHQQRVLSRLGRPANGTILHPTDYSENSRQAFELACRLARERDSRLIVIHVAPPVEVPFGMATPPPLPVGYRGALEGRLRLIQPRDPIVRIQHRLEEGDVAKAILRVAEEAHCDLIVMGTSGRSGLSALLTRSVAKAVKKDAPCPVLTVGLPAGGGEVPDLVTEEATAGSQWASPIKDHYCTAYSGKK